MTIAEKHQAEFPLIYQIINELKQAKQKIVTEAQAYCWSCGKRDFEGNIFCMTCGSRLSPHATTHPNILD